jgi:hypothetical protein
MLISLEVKQKRIIPFFPESIFGNPKTDAERN